MSNAKKTAKQTVAPEDVQAAVAAALQKLIAQGKKEGMIRAADLNAQLEKLQLTAEKIEEIYDQFDAMNIPIITAELDLGDDLDLGDSDDIDLSGLDEEDLVDPVDLAAEYSLDFQDWDLSHPSHLDLRMSHGTAADLRKIIRTEKDHRFSVYMKILWTEWSRNMYVHSQWVTGEISAG